MTIEQAYKHYVSGKRAFIAVSLLALIWLVLPIPYPFEEKESDDVPSGLSDTIRNSGSIPLAQHLRQGIMRTRGAWETHPVWAIVTYAVLHDNVVSFAIGLILLRKKRKPSRKQIGGAHLFGVFAGAALWTLCWGYQRYLWYILVFFGNLLFMASVLRSISKEEGSGPKLGTPSTHRKTPPLLKANPVHASSQSAQRQRIPLAIERMADELERNGQFDRALALYTDFLSHNPHSLQGLNNAATLNLQLGRHTDAVKLLERAVALAPDYVKAWNNLAAARGHLLDYVGAEQAYETALEHDPRNEIARTGLAKIKGQLRSLGMRTREERGTTAGGHTCDSCGRQYSERGAWSPSNRAIGGAICNHCGRFYCEPCVGRKVLANKEEDFRCSCGHSSMSLDPSDGTLRFENFSEIVVFGN